MADRDGFDGEIERMFARPPALDGADVFAAGVERRLNRNWRMRTVILSAAGLVGGVFAVREALQAGVEPGLVRLTNSYSSLAQASSWRADSVIDGINLAIVHNPSMAAFWLASVVLVAAAGLVGWRVDQA